MWCDYSQTQTSIPTTIVLKQTILYLITISWGNWKSPSNVFKSWLRFNNVSYANTRKEYFGIVSREQRNVSVVEGFFRLKDGGFPTTSKLHAKITRKEMSKLRKSAT